jgi:chromosome segregation protein
MEGSLFEKEETIEAKRREIFRIAEDISHLRNEMGRVLTSIENLERKHAATLRETETAREQLSRIEASIRETDGALINKNNELLLFIEQTRILSADIDGYRARAEDSRNAIARVREELASASSRLASLREIMHEDLPRESLAEDLRIIASIAEVIDVDEAYEKAIENALAEKINGLLSSLLTTSRLRPLA